MLRFLATVFNKPVGLMRVPCAYNGNQGSLQSIVATGAS